MPITNQYYGGQRRIYVSGLAEDESSGYGETAQTLAMVFNGIDDTAANAPVEEILDNANSAQGQGEHATRLYKGAQDLQPVVSSWLTSEILGVFGAMALGDVAISAAIDTTGYQHTITPAVDEEPSPHTMEDHVAGSTDTVTGFKYTGVTVNEFSFNVNPANEFVRFRANCVASDHDTGTDQSSGIDSDTSNWPLIPGFAPTKVALYLDPTTGSNHTTTYDGTITTPSAAGTPFNDLGGSPVNYGEYGSFTFRYTNNLDLTRMYQAGMSSGSGFRRLKPYAVNRRAFITGTFDLTGQSDEFLLHDKLFTDAAPKSWTAQITGVGDVLVGATTLYYGFSIVNPAMKLNRATPSPGLGPMSVDIELESMLDNAGGSFCTIYTWTKISTDYDATA